MEPEIADKMQIKIRHCTEKSFKGYYEYEYPCCKVHLISNYRECEIEDCPTIECGNCNNQFIIDHRSLKSVSWDDWNNRDNWKGWEYKYNLIFFDRIYNETIEDILFEKENIKYSKKLYELLETTKPPRLSDLSDNFSREKAKEYLESLEVYSKHFKVKSSQQIKHILERFLEDEQSQLRTELELIELKEIDDNKEDNDYFRGYITVNSYCYENPMKEYPKNFRNPSLTYQETIVSGVNIYSERIFFNVDNYNVITKMN
jgi:hypothetical protein